MEVQFLVLVEPVGCIGRSKEHVNVIGIITRSSKVVVTSIDGIEDSIAINIGRFPQEKAGNESREFADRLRSESVIIVMIEIDVLAVNQLDSFVF